MAPVTKLEDLTAASLMLGAPASKTSASDDNTSPAASSQVIYQLLLLIGQNMSKMQQLNAQNNLNQAQVDKSMEDSVIQAATTQSYITDAATKSLNSVSLTTTSLLYGMIDQIKGEKKVPFPPELIALLEQVVELVSKKPSQETIQQLASVLGQIAQVIKSNAGIAKGLIVNNENPNTQDTASIDNIFGSPEKLKQLVDQLTAALKKTASDSKIVSLTPAKNNDLSRSEAFDLIFQLLLLIGQNMSKMQQANAETNINQSKVAQAQSNATQQTATQQLKELSEQRAQLDEQARLGPLFIFLKVLAAVVSVVIAIFSCGTAAGVLLALVVIAVTSSPAFDYAVAGVASALEADGVDSGTAKIIADVVMTVAVAIVSFGTEIIGGALQAGAAAGEAAAETAVSTGTRLAAKAASSITAASTEAIISAIVSSGLITDIIDKIPGAKNVPFLSAIIAILVQIAALIVAGKFASGNSDASFISTLSKKITPELIQKLTPMLGLVGGLSSAGAGAGEGAMTVKESQIRRNLAPLESMQSLLQGLMQIWTQLVSDSQKSMSSTIRNYENIFKIDFSRDMKACVDAQYQG